MVREALERRLKGKEPGRRRVVGSRTLTPRPYSSLSGLNPLHPKDNTRVIRERDDALLSELAQPDEAAGVGYVGEGELIHEALALLEMLLEPISLFADINRHKPLRQMRWAPGCATIGVVLRDITPRRAEIHHREGGVRKMPVYVTLLNWTDQGIRNVREAVQRVDSGVQVAEQKYGVRLRDVYWTVGPYDYVGLWEAPDEQSMSAFMLELGSLGNVRSTTLRAYDRDEMGGILERLG